MWYVWVSSDEAVAGGSVKLGRKQILVILLGGLLLALSSQLMGFSGDRVTASVETEPVANRGDAADDPAIWVHPTEPTLSTIIGTDKKTGGLAVYDLDGRQIQFVKMSGVNNVDLREGFPLDRERVSLVLASNPKSQTIEVFRVDLGSRQLRHVIANGNRSDFKVWGICLYRSANTGRYYAFSIGKGGQIEQWEIMPEGASVTLKRVRAFNLGGDSEACVVDDKMGVVYVGEEEKGIWRFGAEPNSGNDGRLVDTAKRWSGPLRADVEGLTVYDAGQDRGYLIASSQGNDSFVVYDRSSNAYIGTFEIHGGRVDGVSNTDGIEVTHRALGPEFPYGLFVAQDDTNQDSYFRKKLQNFKLVPWEAIAGHFKPSLYINNKTVK